MVGLSASGVKIQSEEKLEPYPSDQVRNMVRLLEYEASQVSYRLGETAKTPSETGSQRAPCPSNDLTGQRHDIVAR